MPTIPQPRERFIIGNIAEIDINDPLSSLERLQSLYGDIFKLKVPGATLIVVSSQELVHFICTDERFDKKVGRPLMEVRNVAGDGLFTAVRHLKLQEAQLMKLAHRRTKLATGTQAFDTSLWASFDSWYDLKRSGSDLLTCRNVSRHGRHCRPDGLTLGAFRRRGHRCVRRLYQAYIGRDSPCELQVRTLWIFAWHGANDHF